VGVAGNDVTNRWRPWDPGSCRFNDSTIPHLLAVVLMMLFSIAVLVFVLCCTAIPRSAGSCSGKLMDVFSYKQYMNALDERMYSLPLILCNC